MSLGASNCPQWEGHELALAQENIQNQQSRLEFWGVWVHSWRWEKWKVGVILKKMSKELSFRRLSEIEKAERRCKHSSCVCLCLYGFSYHFAAFLTHRWHQVTMRAKCCQSGIFHVCTFPCAPWATPVNYNHLYSSQNWALALGRAHLPSALFQVCSFMYTFVYLKNLGLYFFFYCYRMCGLLSCPCVLLGRALLMPPFLFPLLVVLA